MPKQVIPRTSNSSLQNEVLFSMYCSDVKISVRSCTEGPCYVLYNRVCGHLKNDTKDLIYKTEIRVTDVENKFTVTKSEVGER